MSKIIEIRFADEMEVFRQNNPEWIEDAPIDNEQIGATLAGNDIYLAPRNANLIVAGKKSMLVEMGCRFIDSGEDVDIIMFAAAGFGCIFTKK